jgi:hypothetical protein
MTTYRISLISAGSISPDNTFKLKQTYVKFLLSWLFVSGYEKVTEKLSTFCEFAGSSENFWAGYSFQDMKNYLLCEFAGSLENF